MLGATQFEMALQRREAPAVHCQQVFGANALARGSDVPWLARLILDLQSCEAMDLIWSDAAMTNNGIDKDARIEAAAVLKKLRIRNGIKQATLAEFLGINVPDLSNIENGGRPASVRLLSDWCDALDELVENQPDLEAWSGAEVKERWLTRGSL